MTDRPVSRRRMRCKIVQYLAMWFLDLLVPLRCVFCGVTSEGSEKSICAACYADLPWNEPSVSTTPGIFECSITMLHYSFPIDAAIKALKFSRKLHYVPAFGEVLCAARSYLPHDIDAVLPVPLHWRRETFRGFNQAMEIAMPVARMLDVPVVRGVRRIRATPYQSGLEAAERARNLKGAFVASRVNRHAHVLIIDDVVTTSSPLTEAAAALRRAGAVHVVGICAARASSISCS